MSEFQYFEFRAVDRPLTDAEMRKLRTYSSRAIITPTGFTNHYDWGDFKGDEDAWMEKYFDVFLYFANWGTHVLMFRLPSESLPLKLARMYCPRESARAWEKAGKVILALVSEDEEGDQWDEIETTLDSFVPVRDEIARGDLRALYLAWLLCVQNSEIEKGEKEPPVPPNLARLSAPQRKMAEFLRIDEHLLAAAAQASPKIADEPCTESELLNWLGALSTGEKDKMLVDAMRGKKCRLGDEMMARFVRERRRIPSAPPGAKRRTVAELLHIADEFRQAEEKRAEEEDARRKQKAIAAREKFLDSLVGREEKIWAAIQRLVAETKRESYDEAVRLLSDLRDLAARKGDGDFRRRVAVLLADNARKPAFIQKMKSAGL